MLFERRGVDSIKTLFNKTLDKLVLEDYGNAFVTDWSLYHNQEALKKQFAKARATKIILKKEVCGNSVDGDAKHTETWEVSFTVKSRDSFFDKLTDLDESEVLTFLRSRPGYSKVLVNGMEPTSVQVEVSMDGRKRKVSFLDDGSSQFKGSFDVTDDIVWNQRTRFRTQSSIIEVAFGLVNDLDPL